MTEAGDDVVDDGEGGLKEPLEAELECDSNNKASRCCWGWR